MTQRCAICMQPLDMPCWAEVKSKLHEQGVFVIALAHENCKKHAVTPGGTDGS